MATAAEMEEMDRLVRKRARYAERSLPTQSLDRQLDRVQRRVVERIREVLPPGEPVEPALRELMGPPDERDEGRTPGDRRPVPPRRTPGGIVLP